MADQIKVIMDGLDRLTERVVSDLAIEITANLVEDTPVDIGWARANWIPNIGAPAFSQFDRVPEPGDVPIAMARQSAGQASVKTSYSIADGPVFVSNNVPYIQRLNDGWSTQAPKGFVQAAVDRGVRTVQRYYSGGF